jgi:hypothetical protein
MCSSPKMIFAELANREASFPPGEGAFFSKIFQRFAKNE